MRKLVSANALAAALGFTAIGGAGGCTSSSTVAEGNVGAHTVLATAELGNVAVRVREEAADLTVAGKTFHVTPSQLTWKPDGVIALPEQWNRLELRQFRREIFVLLDDKQIGKVPTK
jgi:hypothetical protein